MSSVPVPGLHGLLGNPSFGKDEKCLNRDPEAQASGEHRCNALFGERLRDDFRFGERQRSEIRDNDAAWVAGPSRICFLAAFRPDTRGGCPYFSLSGRIEFVLIFLPALFHARHDGLFGWFRAEAVCASR